MSTNNTLETNKAQKAQFLRYGHQIIFVSNSTSSNLGISATNVPDKKFYLGAKNIHNPEVYFLKEKLEIGKTAHFYAGLSEMIFEIVPRLQFESQAFIDTIDDHDPKLPLYQKRLKVEQELNKSIINSSKGKIVSIGDHIQLFHPSSGMFLKTTNSQGFYGAHNALSMDLKSSLNTQFQIKSTLPFRKAGSHLMISDDFYLTNQAQCIVYPIDQDICDRSEYTLHSNNINRNKKIPKLKIDEHIRLPQLM